MKIKIPKDPFKNLVLDEYEQEIEDAFEKGDITPIPNQKEEIERYRSYFKNFNKKNKRISIRVAEGDLKEIQKRAIESGIPYQTLVAAILHKYVKSEFSIGI